MGDQLGEQIDNEDTLTDLLAYQEYYCKRCGAKMTPPTMEAVGYDRIDGSAILHGMYRCPNRSTLSWLSWGHDELLVEYNGCDLRVFEQNNGEWVLYDTLHKHELSEEKARREKGANDVNT